MLRILLNGSTMYDGGGIQVITNFIKDTFSENEDDIEWFYMVSERVNNFLNAAGVVIPVDNSLILPHTPSRLRGRMNLIKQINKFKTDKGVDLVYSISSPSYINFNKLEIQRLTNPYITNPNEHAYGVYPLLQRIKRRLMSVGQTYALRNCKYYITQTAIAQKNISKKFGLPLENVIVIPNAVSKFFYEKAENTLGDHTENDIFCLFTPNPHKNLSSLPKIAKELEALMGNDNQKFRFLTTVEPSNPLFIEAMEEAKKLGVRKYFHNLGRLTQAECAVIYKKSKVCLLPTYLEVFSATLIESMFMGAPMVTTNFDFNTSVAGDAAYYFNPGEWNVAAKGLSRMLQDDNFRQEHIDKGFAKIKDFPDSNECYRMTISALKQIYFKENK